MAMAEPSSKKRKLAGGQRQRVAQLLSNEKAGSAEPVPPVKSCLQRILFTSGLGENFHHRKSSIQLTLRAKIFWQLVGKSL